MTLRPLLLLAVVFTPLLASAASATWVVDKASSSLRFSSTFGGDPFAGAFRRWDAAIRFDPADLAHSRVTVSVDVASAFTGSPDRDQALPGGDFFAAAKFPRATFEATTIRMTAPGHYDAIGSLTLRGVSRPLTLPFSLAITGPTARMSATTSINRLAFGVGQNEWKATTTLPAAVKLTIAVTAHKGG